MARKGGKKGRPSPSRKGGGRGGRRGVGLTLGGLALVAGIAVAVGVTLSVRAPAATTVPEALRVRVVRSYPHARDAFTQGLVYDGGRLFESTGLSGRSSLREVELETGRIVRRNDLPAPLFAEGLAQVDDRLWQLTWHDGKALVWNVDDFERIGTHGYRGEGWGLCFDGEHLVMSDGTAHLAFRDPETFELERRVRVTKVGRPVKNLNELECVDGQVWANIWRSEEIVRIDPATGGVTATVDASGLLAPEEAQGVDVLNGIAYVPERERFLLTGKLWPRIFEVEMVPR